MDVNVINLTRSLDRPLRVRHCESFLCRFRGLMFTNSISEEAGLLMIHPTESRSNAAIHMFFVGMDLGVIWMDKENNVVDKVLAKSWKPFYQPGSPAKSILEVHPERLPEFDLGDTLSFE